MLQKGRCLVFQDLGSGSSVWDWAGVIPCRCPLGVAVGREVWAVLPNGVKNAWFGFPEFLCSSPGMPKVLCPLRGPELSGIVPWDGMGMPGWFYVRML